MNFNDVVNRFENVKKGIGNEFTALCPAHDDRYNSLSITEGIDRKILLYCHAGCTVENIAKSIGLNMDDLFPNEIIRKTKEVVEEYQYTDFNGNVLHKTIRYNPKGFTQCRPDGKGGWIHNLKDITTVPYNLPGLARAIREGETVYIVEGEKDANTLRKLGLQATTSPMGAGKWHDYYSDYLTNATVVIIPDNDDAGKQHANQVSISLLGKAKSIKVIDLKKAYFKLPDKGDITDFINNFGSVKGIEKLKELCNSAPEWNNESYINDFISSDTNDTNDTISENEMDAPIPFDEYQLPEFPAYCLPEWLRLYVEAVAEETQTPVDMAAVTALSTIACALSKEIKIKGKQGWIEPLNLYTAVIMKPGERKSAVFANITDVIVDYEADRNEKLLTEIHRSQTEKRILEEELRVLEAKASKGKDKEAKEMALEKSEELAEFKEVKQLRLLADDVSPEKISSLLSENNGRMAIMSAEGGIFEILAGRYSQNGSSNIDAFLKGHSGDMLRVDRIGRASEHIKGPALTVGLAIQPDVLCGIMRNSNFRGRGLTARFLFSMPTSKIGYRNIESQSVPKEIRDTYKNCIRSLLDIDIMNDEKTLSLSKEAIRISNEFANKLEPRLVNDLECISDWTGKLHGAVLRVTGILHMSQNILKQEPWDIEVSQDIISKAIVIGEYFIEHAKAAFSLMGADKDNEDAKYILKWIKRQNIVEFKKRDAHRAMISRFKKSEETDIPIGLLCEHNYIQIIEESQINGKGRKSSTRYKVNPLLFNEGSISVNNVNSVNIG